MCATNILLISIMEFVTEMYPKTINKKHTRTFQLFINWSTISAKLVRTISAAIINIRTISKHICTLNFPNRNAFFFCECVIVLTNRQSALSIYQNASEHNWHHFCHCPQRRPPNKNNNMSSFPSLFAVWECVCVSYLGGVSQTQRELCDSYQR